MLSTFNPIYLFSVILCFFFGNVSNEKTSITEPYPKKKEPPYIEQQSKWADSVFNTLTAEDKIAQLIMVDISPRWGKENIDKIDTIITKNKIGGIMLHKGGPVEQALLINMLQSKSVVPLMVAIDGEWGLSMRFDSVHQFPKNITLGAVQNDELIYDLGQIIGKECKRMGIHINFAPVIDVNNNPDNPIINFRSYGESPYVVAQKGIAFMKGLQSLNILAVAKHFPGHGDTHLDSHFELPFIYHDFNHLEKTELYPFKKLIYNGIGGVMVAHLHVPALDSAKNIPTSLSKKVVSGLLKEELKYQGLIFSDALNMKAIESYIKPEDASLNALLAGNDIILMPKDIPLTIQKIKSAADSGLVSWTEIDAKCRKVINAKKWFGLDNYIPVDINNITNDLNSDEGQVIKSKLFELAITLVKNNEELIPLKDLDKFKTASVYIGSKNDSVFKESLSLYDSLTFFSINKSEKTTEFDEMVDSCSKFDRVIVVLGSLNNLAKGNYGITTQSVDFVKKLSRKTKVILDLFGNPYALRLFAGNNDINSILVSFEDNDICQKKSAQIIYGGISARGKLPVSPTPFLKAGTGATTEEIRFKYIEPIELKIDIQKFLKIDSIVKQAIKEKAFPGCQVFAAKGKTVFFYKSYGYHTYDSLLPVKNTDIYDLASITKVAATTLSMMKLYDNDVFSMKDKLSDYISELKNTQMKDVSFKETFAHYGRISSVLPYYKYSVLKETKQLNPLYFNSLSSKWYNIEVADSLYASKELNDTLFKIIYNTPLRKKLDYHYSDLGFIMFKQIIESTQKISLDNFVTSNFYNSLGANTLTYNPLNKFDKSRIVPTENDQTFRGRLIHGYVHDPFAALIGGVSGHAGLFSDANDLAKLMLVFLQNGEYGGTKYFSEKTVKLFTSRAFNQNICRRGYGFDKPENGGGGSCSELASDKSFGHTGFTGTIVWADPENELLFIFLSNRVYPDATDNKLQKMGIRNKIHTILYQVLEQQNVILASK